ncbi:MAG: sugar phosphate isomerase/epimerase family protein, partial [Bacteroidota bacterium]
MSNLKRRAFIKNTTLAAAGLGLSLQGRVKNTSNTQPLFKISLAEWSIHRSLFSGKMKHLDFPILARQHKISAIEYVNQFFMDKAKDTAFLREMKDRADSEGVRSLLIMCDREGALGHPDTKKRAQTVENHKKWVDAAKYLGCHSIRVNGFSGGSWGSPPDDFEESQKLVADGLRQLCEYADPIGLNVIIENHGGNSSNAQWLMGVMKMTNHEKAGTLPDFGNFRIYKDKAGKVTSYDAYRGVKELLPLAKGVSVKTIAWDDKGNESPLDYDRMLSIVLDSGFRGYCGIEHGEEGREWAAIGEVRQKLLESRDRLRPKY